MTWKDYVPLKKNTDTTHLHGHNTSIFNPYPIAIYPYFTYF